MTARWIVADVFDGLATVDDSAVDLVITSPPFLALRSYLPADHPDKDKEIGSEATPAAFLDVMLAVTAELRRVLAPHGSIAIELGDTYAGSGGAGGDYDPEGLRAGQPKFRQQPPNTAHRLHDDGSLKTDSTTRASEPKNLGHRTPLPAGPGWPLAKCKALIPELYRIALAYGINPLTGQESPAGRWRIRNVVTWCKPNPAVGALGDKWRAATSDVVVACVSDKRYWDDIATRRPHKYGDYAPPKGVKMTDGSRPSGGDVGSTPGELIQPNSHGAPLLDYWEIPPGGYKGAHYAVFPQALVEPLIKAMAPPKVCRTCGEPSRRIIETTHLTGETNSHRGMGIGSPLRGGDMARVHSSTSNTLGWSDCFCKPPGQGVTSTTKWRPALVLDPFAGSGTTLSVATGHGYDAIGIDLDERNRDLARERIGPFLFDETPAVPPKEKT